MTSLAQLTPRERIIRSLFNEKDESGALLESYITHVKIFEDAQYPSEPPLEPTPPENLKERYILLSVKKNGRVRMHKSRGNDNGTFQIGKTWGLEDLQRIEDTDRRGFIISLLKPYYWTMESAKDKYMFVSALTKVYKKYTGGRMFDMVNFDAQHVPVADRPANAGQQQPQQRRQERSVSAQVPSERTPQQTSPLKTQRIVSEFRDSGQRDQQRQGSITTLPTGMPSYTPSAGGRVTSSQYGGPDTRLSSLSTNMSPPIARPQQRSISGASEDRPRRGAVPFASPPIQQLPTMALDSTISARPVQHESPPSTIRLDTRLARTNPASLGSPMTFNDSQGDGSPVLEKLPEKSLRRQAIDSPTTDLAAAIRNNASIPNYAYPMSPPTPAKSPARRPSNVRTMSSGSSRALLDRQGGTIPAIDSVASSPVPDVPSLPSKSGARPVDGRSVERHSVPWQTPMEQPRSDDYFTAIKGQVINGQAGTQDDSAKIVDRASPIAQEAIAFTKPAQQNSETEQDQATPSLEDETSQIEDPIKDFKWTARDGVGALAMQLQEELALLEAANIHSIVENDSRLADLMAKLDKGIDQCQDMENLLTIYEFELATVADNIKDIEGQSQGLQVQTANQVALVEEISRVLSSITISEADLDVLKGRGGNLESSEGIANIEKSLINLYRALKSLRDERSTGSDNSMSAMHSKNQEYLANSSGFLARLSKYLQIKFQAALLTKEGDSVSRSEPSHVLAGHDDGFMALAPYAALMLYAREIEPKYHTEYMKSYTTAAKAAWQDPIKKFTAQWKAHARRATTEETDMMFTSSKDQQSAGANLNALKRSNTLAKQIRSVASTKADKENGISRTPAGEVFRTILDNFVLLLANEQNFLVTFFHLSSFSSYDYADYVELEVKSRLTVASLDDHKPTEPNRQFAKERYLLMEAIFGWATSELVALIDFLAGLDAIQIIGILKSLEVVIAEWSDSDQEFMLRTLSKFKDRAAALLSRFLEAQVRAIKETKITSKKRKGVIPVFEIFPDVVERIEIQLRSSESNLVNTNQLEIRRTVNDAYEQMNKAMFDSVRTIASSASVQGTSDPEDKEVLNYHILMIQNMHQYLEALQSRNNPILEGFRASAKKQYAEHLHSYTRQIIARPIGRIMDFTETFEKSMRQKEDPLGKSTFSQASVKRLLSDHDERDMRKGISGMFKRVDKHFNEDDGSKNTLLGLVWGSVQQDYLAITDRTLSILQTHYSDVKVDWTRQTLVAAFAKREI